MPISNIINTMTDSDTYVLNKRFKLVLPVEVYENNEYTDLRRAELLLIKDCLKTNKLYKKNSNKDLLEIIMTIEKNCYEMSIKKSIELGVITSWNIEEFENIYRSIISRVTKNLDSSSEVKSMYLSNHILRKKIDINKISQLSSEEMCPQRTKKIKHSIEQRFNQKIKQKTSSMYRCKNCGKNQTIITEVQLRSLDEGANLSILCCFCRRNWIL